MVERVLQRRMIAVAPIDVSKTGMMLLNNSVALVPMSLLLVAFGEPSRWHVVRVRRDGEMRGDAGGDTGRYREMQRDIGRWHVARVRFGEGQASAPACRVR